MHTLSPAAAHLARLLPDLGSLRSWTQVHRAVERIHRRPIVVGPAPRSLGRWVSGIWLQAEGTSYIFHDEGCVESELFVQHIVAHEYGHILLRHDGCELSIGTAFSAVGPDKSVRQILARGERWTAQERAAEEIAVALATHLATHSDPILDVFG